MRRLAKWSIGIGSFIGCLIALLALLLCTGVIRVYGLTTGYNQLPQELQARVVFSQGSLTDLDKALAQVRQQRSVLLVRQSHERAVNGLFISIKRAVAHLPALRSHLSHIMPSSWGHVRSLSPWTCVRSYSSIQSRSSALTSATIIPRGALLSKTSSSQTSPSPRTMSITISSSSKMGNS